MSQPIVPLGVPQSRRFKKKDRHDILIKIRVEKLKLTFFQAVNQDVLETILDWKGLSSEERFAKRQVELKPLMEEFF